LSTTHFFGNFATNSTTMQRRIAKPAGPVDTTVVHKNGCVVPHEQPITAKSEPLPAKGNGKLHTFPRSNNTAGGRGDEEEESVLLRRIDQMPPHLRFNKYILSGYRPLSDFWTCMKSIGSFHNETLNIVTHLIPIVYVVLWWRSMFPWSEIEGNVLLNSLGVAHIAASVAPWVGSVIYHLFMS